MKKYLTLLVMTITISGTACQPSQGAIQTAIAQTQSFQYIVQTAIAQTQLPPPTATFTPFPTIPPTTTVTAACSVDVARVMDYFNLHGYSNFSEGGKEGGTPALILDELDSDGYGRTAGVQYDGSCALQIKAVVTDHVPPTETEKNLDSNFLATITGAGLTDQQARMMLAWLSSADHQNLLPNAIKNGKATDSVHLSSSNEYPFAELTYEFFPSKFLITFVIVFETRNALDYGGPTTPPGTEGSLCYSWDKVTKSFAGKTVCVFGVVQSKYDATTNWSYRYIIKFSNERNTFYLVDVNPYRFSQKTFYLYEYPNLHLGDCVNSVGTIELDTDQTPFMKLGKDLMPCP